VSIVNNEGPGDILCFLPGMEVSLPYEVNANRPHQTQFIY
jgi:hypothetical protein